MHKGTWKTHNSEPKHLGKCGWTFTNLCGRNDLDYPRTSKEILCKNAGFIFQHFDGGSLFIYMLHDVLNY